MSLNLTAASRRGMKKDRANEQKLALREKKRKEIAELNEFVKFVEGLML